MSIVEILCPLEYVILNNIILTRFLVRVYDKCKLPEVQQMNLLHLLTFTFSFQCKGTKLYKKYCLLTKQTIKELRKTITHVHTQRRDWTKLIYESQIAFITTLRSKLNLLDNRMRMVSSFLRKAMKKSNMS